MKTLVDAAKAVCLNRSMWKDKFFPKKDPLLSHQKKCVRQRDIK